MKAQLLEFSLYFRWFWQYWKKEKLRMILVILLTMVVIAAKTAFPLLLKYIIDMLSGDFDIESVNKLLLIFIGASVIHEILAHALPVTRAYMNNIFGSRMREKYFGIYTNMPLEFFKKFRTGDLLTRLTDDIDGSWDRLLWYSCSGVLRPFEAILVLAFTLSIMFHYSFWLTLLTFLPLPFLVLIMAKTEHKMVQYTNIKQKSVSDCNNIIESCFSGIKVIKTTISEDDQLRKYNEVIFDRVKRKKTF
jgi:ABC-type multidrug transport system fused ATPase/permease subunit